MASIRKEIVIDAAPALVWDAVRDVGALHTRLVPGFVTDTRMDGDARIVTFGSGLVVRERIVDIDDTGRRLVWSAVGDGIAHHNGAMQIFDEGAGCRALWIADVLPHDLARLVSRMMEQSLATMKATLEKRLADA